MTLSVCEHRGHLYVYSSSCLLPITDDVKLFKDKFVFILSICFLTLWYLSLYKLIIHPFIHLSIHLSIYPYNCPFIHPMFHPFINPSIHLSLLFLYSRVIHSKTLMRLTVQLITHHLSQDNRLMRTVLIDTSTL